jgi:hypothetical protein
LTDIELKNLLLRMIHSNYKIRPSAKEVLNSPTIRDHVNKTKTELKLYIAFVFIQICHMSSSPFAFNQHRHEHVKFNK